MEGGAGSGTGAALAVLSNSDDPAPPTSEAPARVAAPLRNSRRSTKLFLVGTGTFSSWLPLQFAEKPKTLSFRSRLAGEGSLFSLALKPREIPHFVRNDKKAFFFVIC
jgi:hypothetical protein